MGILRAQMGSIGCIVCSGLKTHLYQISVLMLISYIIIFIPSRFCNTLSNTVLLTNLMLVLLTSYQLASYTDLLKVSVITA